MAEDRALVEQCLRGNAEAVRLLIERYQADVLGLCRRLLGHLHDAEDVAQEVFLRIFRSLHRWDGNRPLRPWIMGIAVNRCRTSMASRRRQPDLADYLQETAVHHTTDETDELRREIAVAVAELRPDYQAVFVMFHQMGRPYEEIAQALNRPVGTVKTWLHRARVEVLNRLKVRGMVTEDMRIEATTTPSSMPSER